MWSTILVGTPRGNDHRAIEAPGLDLPFDIVGGWTRLGNAQLLAGQALMMVSRHRYGEKIYTWFGTYSYAAEMDASRERGGYIGAGLLIENKVVPSGPVLAIIREVHDAFRALAVRQEKFCREIDSFGIADLRLPEAIGAQYVALEQRAAPLDLAHGLRPEGEKSLDRDPLILVDEDPQVFVPWCVAWVQFSHLFDDADRIYLTTDPSFRQEPPDGARVVTASAFARHGFAAADSRTSVPSLSSLPSGGQAPAPTASPEQEILGAILAELLHIGHNLDRTASPAPAMLPQPSSGHHSNHEGGRQALLGIRWQVWIVIGLVLVAVFSLVIYAADPWSAGIPYDPVSAAERLYR